MAKFRYARASGIRQLVKENNKRVGTGFLTVLDKHIEEIVQSCCRVFNGHRVTLDETVIERVLKSIK